jgi:hypothetical protein
MTRFGMEAEDFETLAQMIHDVITENKSIRKDVARFRSRFLSMRYCFSPDDFKSEFNDLIQTLHDVA